MIDRSGGHAVREGGRESPLSDGPNAVPPRAPTRWAQEGLDDRDRRVVSWARLGSNQRPPACEAGALPLSYAPSAA
jgi:hypothetical protein